jgi:hypothetical protein
MAVETQRPLPQWFLHSSVSDAHQYHLVIPQEPHRSVSGFKIRALLHLLDMGEWRMGVLNHLRGSIP